MNWKKGFRRITCLLPILALVVWAFLSMAYTNEDDDMLYWFLTGAVGVAGLWVVFYTLRYIVYGFVDTPRGLRMLDKTKFLANLSDLRDELYEHFKSVSTYLYDIDDKFGIAAVNCGDPGYSDGTCEVKIPINHDDMGALFHEVGHDLFAKSVFHLSNCPGNSDGNDKWGEAFAEAIRWLMEDQHLRLSKWLKDFDKEKNHPGTDNADKYKAELILEKSSHTPSGFKELWKQLVSGFNDKSDYLDTKLLSV